VLAIAVITISDRAYGGEYEDLSGPKIKEILEQSGLKSEITISVVPDEEDSITNMIQHNLDKDFILTTGGTGISTRDITPEITARICDRALPGISEMLRRESYKETVNAVLSRGYSGMKGKTIIVNFPGSVKAVTLCTQLLIPLMEHAIRMVQDKKH
jgi:molybdenum cofactor synthesis domain-containing protein